MDRQAGDGEDEPVEIPSNQPPQPPRYQFKKKLKCVLFKSVL